MLTHGTSMLALVTAAFFLAVYLFLPVPLSRPHTVNHGGQDCVIWL